MAEPAPDPDGAGVHYNRAARVLTAWVREPEFCTPEGGPRALPMDGERGFAVLVRRHGGDVPVRAVLDELLRVGAVLHRDDGCIELRQRAFVPRTSAVEKLGILGTDVGELIETIDHNIELGATQPRYQRKVMHVGIPVAVLPAFRDMSAAESQALLERFDSWLTARDVEHIGDPAELHDTSTARVGVGVYYFEQLSETR